MRLLSAVAGLSAIFGVDNVACADTHPSDIIDMTDWKLQYATSGDAPEKYPIGTFELSPYFKDVNGRVQFRAYCDGGTTSGSQYPRSELREMNADRTRASWSTSGPASTLRVTMAVTHTPDVRRRLVVAQIHGTTVPYVIFYYDADLQALKWKLYGVEEGTIASNVSLGQQFTLTLKAGRGQVRIYYNGALKAATTQGNSTAYFKTGAYLQSNTQTGEPASAYGEVRIKRVAVTHATR